MRIAAIGKYFVLCVFVTVIGFFAGYAYSTITIKNENDPLKKAEESIKGERINAVPRSGGGSSGNGSLRGSEELNRQERTLPGGVKR